MTSFKVLLLTYKILNGQAPKYLADLISLRSSTSLRPLRSSSTMQLTPGPRTSTKYGDRAFSIIAPSLWNSLSAHIHQATSVNQFKTMLKTYLFNKYFSGISQLWVGQWRCTPTLIFSIHLLIYIQFWTT